VKIFLGDGIINSKRLSYSTIAGSSLFQKTASSVSNLSLSIAAQVCSVNIIEHKNHFLRKKK
jgi:hypothetical protein